MTKVAAMLLVLAASLACLGPARAETADLNATLDQMLKSARAAVTQPCAADTDRLRVGIRQEYPRFGLDTGGELSGFEIDIARSIAARLGVAVQFMVVTPANRISALGEDRVDLVLATMGHTTQRDGQARFIRPHYYASQTVIVGPKSVPASDWQSLSGATVCVPIGSSSNTVLIGHNIRLLLFDTPDHLLEALRQSACQLAAHDDSFFADSLAQPAFAAQYEKKLSFSTLPWGMAVAKDGTLAFARVLSLLSQIDHRDGVFLDLAKKNKIGTDFLVEQQTVWNRPDCDRPAGNEDSSCLLPPTDSSLARLDIAADVERFQAWVQQRFGLQISLPMLQTVVALHLFEDGLVYTVILMVGAMACTLAMAVFFAATLRSDSRVLRAVVRGLTLVMQCSPIVLLLFVGYTVATGLVQYSLTVAIVTSVIVLGLFNGSHAGRAIAEADSELRRERHGVEPGFMLLASRSSVQVTSFLINASKGSAAASMIGTPELLGAMTDISSFSSERITLYSLLLVLYLGLVLVVIALCNMARRYLVRLEHAA